MKNCVVFGGTRGMGRSVARALAARGDAVVLLGRDSTELARSVADLAGRAPSGTKLGSALCDLSKVNTFASALESAAATLGKIDVIVVTAGIFALQERLEEDTKAAHELLALDFTNTIAFCEEARRNLLRNGGGTLVVFSSVAGDRARSSQVIYGAAKAGLTSYLAGLDVRYRSKGLVTVCVKPGFIHTGMTEGMKPPPFAGEPDDVAEVVLDAMDRGLPVVYAPRIWGAVMMAVRMIPRFIMRKTNF